MGSANSGVAAATNSSCWHRQRQACYTRRRSNCTVPVFVRDVMSWRRGCECQQPVEVGSDPRGLMEMFACSDRSAGAPPSSIIHRQKRLPNETGATTTYNTWTLVPFIEPDLETGGAAVIVWAAAAAAAFVCKKGIPTTPAIGVPSMCFGPNTPKNVKEGTSEACYWIACVLG